MKSTCQAIGLLAAFALLFTTHAIGQRSYYPIMPTGYGMHDTYVSAKDHDEERIRDIAFTTTGKGLAVGWENVNFGTINNRSVVLATSDSGYNWQHLSLPLLDTSAAVHCVELLDNGYWAISFMREVEDGYASNRSIYIYDSTLTMVTDSFNYPILYGDADYSYSIDDIYYTSDTVFVYRRYSALGTPYFNELSGLDYFLFDATTGSLSSPTTVDTTTLLGTNGANRTVQFFSGKSYAALLVSGLYVSWNGETPNYFYIPNAVGQLNSILMHPTGLYVSDGWNVLVSSDSGATWNLIQQYIFAGVPTALPGVIGIIDSTVFYCSNNFRCDTNLADTGGYHSFYHGFPHAQAFGGPDQHQILRTAPDGSLHIMGETGIMRIARCPSTAPVITSQPVVQSPQSGDTITLSVSATPSLTGYQWYKYYYSWQESERLLIGTVSSDVYKPTATTIVPSSGPDSIVAYYCTVGMLGCPQDTSNFVVATVLANGEFISNTGFNLYPNPASNVVQVSLNGTPSLAYQLTLINALGQIALQQVLRSELQFTVDGLPAGLYTVYLTSTDQHMVSKLLVR